MNVEYVVWFLAVQTILYGKAMGEEEVNRIFINTNYTVSLDGGYHTILTGKPLTIVIRKNECGHELLNLKGPSPPQWHHHGPQYQGPEEPAAGVSVNAKCRQLYEDINIETYLITHRCDENGKMVTILKIPAREITGNVSTKWLCKVMKNDDNLLIVEFIVKVKTGRSVNVLVNGQQLTFEDTPLPNLEYDGLSTYEFEEGKLLHLACSNIYDDGYLKLKSYDASGITVVDKDQGDQDINEPLIFEQVITSEHDGSYVDCTYVKQRSEYKQEFTYRTIFKLKTKTPSNDNFEISVNGASVRDMARHIENGVTYIIYKMNSKQLIFTCEKKDNGLPGNLRIQYDNQTGYAVNRTLVNTNTKGSVLLNTERLDGGKISCISGEIKSDIIKFQRDTNPAPAEETNSSLKDNTITVIVICVTIIILAIVTAVCVICWFKRNRNNGEQNLNEGFNQFDNPLPRPRDNTDNYEYTYIENEYNYIINDGVMLDNSLYRGEYAIPQINNRVSSCFTKNTNANPNYATTYEHSQNIAKKQSIYNKNNESAGSNDKQFYEKNMTYKNLQQRYLYNNTLQNSQRCSVKENGNLQKEKDINYSNLHKK